LKDDGRPIGIGFQEQVSNHPRLQWLRVTVVSAGARCRVIPYAGKGQRDE